MSKENYDALLTPILAIEDAATLTPNMPIDAFVQEAGNLEVWSSEDREKLIGVGVPQSLFDEFPKRIGALRYAQSLWMKDRYSQEEARQEWEEKSPEAFKLKNELEHTFRFAFRKRPDLLSKVKTIEEGMSDADMVQDLSDLSVLGQANLPLLKAINYKESQLKKAETMAAEMSILLATMNGERAENNNAKLVRDKAYTLLKRAVDDIRSAGKYIFWKDAKHYKGYTSHYLRSLNQNREKTGTL